MSLGLIEARNLLVRRWGEMGGYWGINRTMAEIHALLFVSRNPLCTDDIMEQLQISRGNTSMNLRALVDWGLIRKSHKLGDRKEYFEADTDVWRMFETIMRERRRREVEPIIATLDRCGEVPEHVGADDEARSDVREFRRRIESLKQFLITMSKLFELTLQLGPEGLGQLTAMMTQEEAAAPKTRRRKAGSAR